MLALLIDQMGNTADTQYWSTVMLHYYMHIEMSNNANANLLANPTQTDLEPFLRKYTDTMTRDGDRIFE